jgi:uncharacterized damage-inducible protein DinB
MDSAVWQTKVDCHYWATERMLDSVAGLSTEQLAQELVSSFPSIHVTLVHMLLSECFLLSTLRQQALEFPKPEDLPTVTLLRDHWQQFRTKLNQFVEQQTPEAWMRTVTLKPAPDKELRLQAWQVLDQLITHGTYHRGQVTTMLRQVGGTPVNTDPIFFYADRTSPTRTS